MEQVQFASRFSELSVRAENKENSDQFITDFAELYIAGDKDQKRMLFDFLGKKNINLNLEAYVRKAAITIKSKEDIKWLQLGFATASLDGARWDFKEIDVSLALLRYAAERVGIDAKQYFDEAIQNADERFQPYLTRNRDEDIRFAVQMFGPREWVAESVGQHGEHPLYTKLKKKKGFLGLFG